MAEVFTAIELHPELLFEYPGPVNKWMNLLVLDVKENVKAKAPPNRSRAKWPRSGTGALLASIRGTMIVSGPLENTGTVSVNVPYAEFVLGGTAFQGTRYIYKSNVDKAFIDKLIRSRNPSNRQKRLKVNREELKGMYMVLPLNGFGSRFHLRVHGQRANNFLFDGYNVVAHQHPRTLSPFRNKFAF